MLILSLTTQALVRSDYCAEIVGSVKSNLSNNRFEFGQFGWSNS